MEELCFILQPICTLEFVGLSVNHSHNQIDWLDSYLHCGRVHFDSLCLCEEGERIEIGTREKSGECWNAYLAETVTFPSPWKSELCCGALLAFNTRVETLTIHESTESFPKNVHGFSTFSSVGENRIKGGNLQNKDRETKRSRGEPRSWVV